ncbi:MAG: GerMN domain-containing protein [Cyanobacteria bacterium J06639_1]
MKALHAHPHHVSREVLAGIAILALALGLGTWCRSPVQVIPRLASPRLEQSDRAVVDLPLQVYWLQATDVTISFAPVTLDIAPRATSQEALTAAVTVLLEGTSEGQDARAIAAIPPRTQLLNLQVQPDGIHVDLSGEFASGGGSTSMVYRVAQVLYTVTSLDPEADVYLSVDGQPLDDTMPLGGEGLLLDRPLARQGFTRDYLARDYLD